MDTHSKEIRSYNMSRIRAKDTKPEVLVRKALFSQGFRFRKNDRRYPGTPDIVLPKYRTVIFVNGCFWHRHPYCRYASTPSTRPEYWLPKLQKNVSTDQRNYAMLEAEGWHVIVIWECELKKKNFEKTMLKVVNELQENFISSVLWDASIEG